MNLRINKEEQKIFNDKCIEINKKLIAKGKAPVRVSELMHFILQKQGRKIDVDNSGRLYIEN